MPAISRSHREGEKQLVLVMANACACLVERKPSSPWPYRPRSSPSSAPTAASRPRSASRLGRGLARTGIWSFCTPDGAPVDSRDDWADWRSLIQEAGIRDVGVHDARHTAATLLLE